LNARLHHKNTLYQPLHELSVNFILDHAALEKGGIDDIMQLLEMVGNNFFKVSNIYYIFVSNELGKGCVVIVDEFLERCPRNTLLCAHF
jgi:hypothetical protein